MKNFIIFIGCFIFMCSIFAAPAKSSHITQKKSVRKKQVQVRKKAKPAVQANLWKQIANDFHLAHRENTPEVKRQITWFQQHPQFFDGIAQHGKIYMHYVYNEVHKKHLPAEVALLPMIESAYDPFAYSWVGAGGMWQIMPQTANNLGLQQDWWYDGRKAIKPSTQAALTYLTVLHRNFNGDWLLAFAAYNMGEGAVQRAINSSGQKSFWNLKLPQETTDYVPRLLALAAIISKPEHYGIKLPYIANKPFFQEMKLDHQVELSKAAELTGITLAQLYELNPGYTRWTTGPEGPYHLLLPSDKIAAFRQHFKEEQV